MTLTANLDYDATSAMCTSTVAAPVPTYTFRKTLIRQSVQWVCSQLRARLTLLRDHDIRQDNGLEVGYGQALPGLWPCLGASLYRPSAAIVLYYRHLHCWQCPQGDRSGLSRMKREGFT